MSHSPHPCRWGTQARKMEMGAATFRWGPDTWYNHLGDHRSVQIIARRRRRSPTLLGKGSNYFPSRSLCCQKDSKAYHLSKHFATCSSPRVSLLWRELIPSCKKINVFSLSQIIWEMLTVIQSPYPSRTWNMHLFGWGQLEHHHYQAKGFTVKNKGSQIFYR